MNNKKLLKFFSLTILLIIVFIGCENKNNPDLDFIYPISVGNNWSYENSFSIFFDSLAAENGLTDTTVYSTGIVEIIENTVIFDSIDCYNFRSTIIESAGNFTGYEFYNNTDNKLISYGYIDPQMITPKNDQQYAYLMFNGKKFNNFREIFNWIEKGLNEYTRDDSIYYDPVKCLEYPLAEGKQWTYRSAGNPFRIDKLILGWEEIYVPSGKLDCWKIQWLYLEEDWDINITFYDYISKEGLVKRKIDISNTECYNENAEFVGYADALEKKVLSDFCVQ